MSPGVDPYSRLTTAYSKIRKRNLVSVNKDAYQRETLAEWPVRLPLTPSFVTLSLEDDVM